MICERCGAEIQQPACARPWTHPRCWPCEKERTRVTSETSAAVGYIVYRVGSPAWRAARAAHPELKPADPAQRQALAELAELCLFDL